MTDVVTPNFEPSSTRLDIIKYILSATPEQIENVSRSVSTGQAEAQRDFKLYTFSAVSKKLGISRMTLWRMVKQGKIATVQTNGGNRRIPGLAIQKFISGE